MKSALKSMALAGLLALPLPVLAQDASRTIKSSIGYSYTSTQFHQQQTQAHRPSLSLEYELERGIGVGIHGTIDMVLRNLPEDGEPEEQDYFDVAPFLDFTVDVSSKIRVRALTTLHAIDPVLEVLGRHHYSLTSELELQLSTNLEHDGPFVRGEYRVTNSVDKEVASVGFRFYRLPGTLSLSMTPHHQDHAYGTHLVYGTISFEYPCLFNLFDISAVLSGRERARLLLKARIPITAASSFEFQIDYFRDYNIYRRQTILSSTSGSAIFTAALP
ncbi:hypothetical protein HYU22_05860 [Candidatus Woesearchaeota archaeon]|nr:hypothetical protein [Candidatus Woesearchaeota archaeon]